MKKIKHQINMLLAMFIVMQDYHTESKPFHNNNLITVKWKFLKATVVKNTVQALRDENADNYMCVVLHPENFIDVGTMNCNSYPDITAEDLIMQQDYTP